MNKHSITTVWKGKNTFATDIDGHSVVVDTAKEGGGDDNGPRPKQLMLAAATGCTGLDAVSILRKMRVDYKNFNVKIDAELTEEHPITYTSMNIIYEFEGEDLPKEKIEKACKLSFEKYCGVIALFKRAIPVTYEVIINNL